MHCPNIFVAVHSTPIFPVVGTLQVGVCKVYATQSNPCMNNMEAVLVNSGQNIQQAGHHPFLLSGRFLPYFLLLHLPDCTVNCVIVSQGSEE